jgi:hypothetical protein
MELTRCTEIHRSRDSIFADPHNCRFAFGTGAGRRLSEISNRPHEIFVRTGCTGTSDCEFNVRVRIGLISGQFEILSRTLKPKGTIFCHECSRSNDWHSNDCVSSCDFISIRLFSCDYDVHLQCHLRFVIFTEPCRPLETESHAFIALLHL